MVYTTIQVKESTLERLKSMKKHERESYDSLLNELIDNSFDEELAPAEIEEIKKSLDDIKNGRVYSIEAVAKELGIQLKG